MLAGDGLGKGRETWTAYVCCEWSIVCCLGVLAILSAPGILNAQTKRGEGEKISPTPSIRIARATRVNRTPLVDGTLNDSLWKTAEPIVDFLQREPNEGQ